MSRYPARRLPAVAVAPAATTSHDHEPADPGVRENARLTAVTGVLMLLPLLVVIGSGLVFGQLWRVHYFAGFAVLPLVLLKLASTGYRAARYYAGSPRYRQAGPPTAALRLLAPVLVVSTVALFLSGVVMWIDHSRAGVWSTLHTDAAVVFCTVLAVHLIAYLPRAWRTARRPRSAPEEGAPSGHRARAASRRRGAVVGTVVFGLVLAVATVPGSQPPQRGPERHHGNAVGVAPPPPAAALEVLNAR